MSTDPEEYRQAMGQAAMGEMEKMDDDFVAACDEFLPHLHVFVEHIAPARTQGEILMVLLGISLRASGVLE